MRRMNLLEACARAAHAQNNIFCRAVGDVPSPAWEDLTPAQRVGTLKGAEHALAGGTPEASHELWMASRIAEGWTFGPVKSFTEKTSPNLVPYAELSPAQRAKDALFQQTMRTMAAILGPVLPG